MNNRVILTISGVVVLMSLLLWIFVFKASGSDSSVSIEGCNPYNVSIKKGEKDNSVVIEWKSKKECSAYIVYGSEMKDLNLIGIDLENEVKDKEHKVVLNTLLSSRTYFFSIISDGVTYGKEGLPISFSISSL